MQALESLTETQVRKLFALNYKNVANEQIFIFIVLSAYELSQNLDVLCPFVSFCCFF